jgi:hypothetical protein
MKKTVRVLGMACALGLFALLGSSCNKETKGVSDITVNMPDLEESFIESERAYIDFSDGRKMKWSEGDQLMVYGLANDYTNSQAEVFTLTRGAGTTVGSFYSPNAVNPKAEIGIFAFYPAAKVENYPLGPGNSQTFDVPATQNYNLNTCDPTSLVMACNGRGILTGSFTMHHIFGMVNLRMKGTKSVASVKVIDKSFNLNGSITADLPGVDPEMLTSLIDQCANYEVPFETYMGALTEYLQGINYTSNPVDKTMTLVCPDVQLNTRTWTNFIITLRPGALANGFIVEVTTTEGDVYTIEKFDPESMQFCVSNNPAYPRGFCVKPGMLTNYNITGIQ